tara:strand:- start:20238 stop:20687 length:450 start_codon:yes stop_codon:yes gene_type:complete
MFSLKIDSDIIKGITEVEINLLLPHEKVLVDKKELIKDNLKYRNNELIISTILICSETNLIIDGHHRFNALKELGFRKVPVTLINYFTDSIITDDIDSLSKREIIFNSINKNLYNPKTTKHLIYCNRNKSWFPINLISSLFLIKKQSQI